MNNVMNRRFSNRERVLMLLLVMILLVGLYFFLVHYPIANRMEEIEEERQEIEAEQAVADARLQTYNDMKAELEEIFALPEDQITKMPDYDNRETLLNYFNIIFAGTDQDLSFDNVQFNENVAERTMRFSFTAEDYDKAVEVLTSLTRAGFRCLLDSLSISPSSGDLTEGSLRVSGTITFYEFQRS